MVWEGPGGHHGFDDRPEGQDRGDEEYQYQGEQDIHRPECDEILPSEILNEKVRLEGSQAEAEGGQAVEGQRKGQGQVVSKAGWQGTGDEKRG